jgi:hypothetical protein
MAVNMFWEMQMAVWSLQWHSSCDQRAYYCRGIDFVVICLIVTD